jgi:hypothetical protein
MERELVRLCSKEPDMGLNHEKINQIYISFLISTLILSSHLRMGLASGFFLAFIKAN